jgi:hypothetical protein
VTCVCVIATVVWKEASRMAVLSHRI